MADARNTDFLRQHARLDRRVSNLETGVHPVKSDTRYENVGTDSGGGGIQFDTYPQDGGWLYVRTTDPDEGAGEPDNWAIHLRDTSTFGGILLESNDSSWFVTHNGTLQLESELATDVLGTAIEIKALAGTIRLQGNIVYLQSGSSANGLVLYDDGHVDITGTPVYINGVAY